MTKKTRTRFNQGLMLFPAGQYLARMLAEMFAKAKVAEEPFTPEGSRSRNHYGVGAHGKPGYESLHPRAHWKRWYRAEQKRQRQVRAINQMSGKPRRLYSLHLSLRLKDVA